MGIIDYPLEAVDILTVLDEEWQSVESIQENLSVRFGWPLRGFKRKSVISCLSTAIDHGIVEHNVGEPVFYRATPKAKLECHSCGEEHYNWSGSIEEPTGLCEDCLALEQTPLDEQIRT